MTTQRTYDVRTHGCQMNVHDSERLAGLLETAGYVDLASIPAAERPATADVVVFNTCAVRENADNKLYGNLGQLRPAKTANPDLQIAVGGCMAQKDRDTIVIGYDQRRGEPRGKVGDAPRSGGSSSLPASEPARAGGAAPVAWNLTAPENVAATKSAASVFASSSSKRSRPTRSTRGWRRWPRWRARARSRRGATRWRRC